MANSGSLTRIQKSVTYLALDCFHSIGIEALLAFATELLEVHLEKSRLPQKLTPGVQYRHLNLHQNIGLVTG